MSDFRFVPAGADSPRRTADFPRVSKDEQAARDAVAEQLVADELATTDTENPQAQAALEAEFQQRFHKPAPGWKFTPTDQGAKAGSGFRFVPLEPEQPAVIKPGEVLRNVLTENPLTAAGEAALNLGSQMVALPVAGIAGLATEAGRALGLTEKTGADVVHAVGGALTYQPRGEFGKAATDLATKPFQALAEAGQSVGGKVLDATGSPLAATAVDTAINAAPMAIGPGIKAGRAGVARARELTMPVAEIDKASPEFKFTPTEAADAQTTSAAPERVQRLAGDDSALHRPQPEGLVEVRGSGNSGMPPVGDVRSVPGGHGAGTDAAVLAGQAGRVEGVQPRELLLDATDAPDAPAPVLSAGAVGGADRHYRGSRAGADGRGLEAAPEDGAVRAEPVGGREPGAAGAQGPALADILRGDADSAAVGRAGRPVDRANMETPDAGMASGTGALSGQPQGTKTARYGLIEADDIKTTVSREAPDWYEREKATQEIVGKLAPERLGKALDDAEGAPIVRRDGVVEVGQKRADALRRVYQANGAKSDAYRAHLREQANGLGLDPAAIDQMRKPVLVRVPDEPVRAGDVQAMASGEVQPSWAPGANYQPMVDQVRAPVSSGKSVAELPDPVRRETILSDLAKSLGTTIYEGRIKSKKMAGFFRPRNHEVRIKNANDLEVAAHEIAHMIDARVPAISNTWRSDKALREELRSVSYDQKSVPEGIAEAVRLWTTQPEALEAKAPRAYAWLEDFANTHPYGPALRKAQAGMTEWFGQDALNRARSKIGGPGERIKDWLDRQRAQWRQSIVDDLDGIYRLERGQTGKIVPNGAYESARLSRASASIADGAVRFGYPVKQADGSFKYAGKGLEEIMKPVAESMDDALLYFVGKSSAELMGQGREHLFTKGEINAMLKLRTPEREAAFAEYQNWNKGILDFAEAQGVINPESRRLWQRTQYLPFHRVGQPGGLKGKPGDWAGIQALTGGTTNIKDVLGNMVANAAMLIDKAVKNEARLKVAKIADQTKGGKWMVKIDTESRPVKISGDQVLDEMFKRYGIAINGDAPAFFQFLIKGQPPAGNNVVAVLKNGKPEWYEVGDPILYRSLMAIDRPLMNTVVKWLGLPKRIGQTTITLTPDFMMANIARDTIMGAVMSRAGFRPIVDSLQGMRLRMTNDPLYRDYIANGGGLSSIYLDETALRTKLERFYGRQGIDYKTVMDTPSKLLHGLETMADAFEMSTRLGEYRRAIQQGENPRHAAYLGRDVSTDFAMRGDSKALGFLYDTVMFLRRAVVSWDRLYRGLAHDPNKGAIAVKAGTIAMLSAALYLLNKDDPRYADLPDWDRDANWHFFVGEHHFRYPKIWEIGALASTAERSVEKLMAEDPAGLGQDFARILGATFNVNLTPQILAPLKEQAMNRNSFTRAPLETSGMENVQPFLRAKPGTSETMKAAGMATADLPEGLQINPVRAEALLRGYFNTYAMYGLMLTDKAFFSDKLPEKRTDELPVVRRFYANEPAKHTKYESEFYDMLQEAKRLRGTMKELDSMDLRGMADDKEKSPLATEAKPLERAAKNLSGINRDMEQVRRSNATPAEKRAKLDGLTIERNALLKQTMTESKAAQKAKAPTQAEVVQQIGTKGH